MQEIKPDAPQYRLIERGDAHPHCEQHPMEELGDIANSATWKVQIIPPDKLRYECTVCHSVRVYKVIPEKTVL